MARPSKAQLKARRAAARAERRLTRAVTYDPTDENHGWVVCDACGFVQPHGISETCLRGRVLGTPENPLQCDSIYCHTVESFKEEAA